VASIKFHILKNIVDIKLISFDQQNFIFGGHIINIQLYIEFI